MAEWIERYSKIKSSSSDDLVSMILKKRGIPEEKHMDFLVPTDEYNYDYDLIRNATRASKKIIGYARDGKNIVVSGDPDADGVTSLAIMYNRIKDIKNDENIEFGLEYIYSQRDTGHGISGQITQKEEHDKLIEDNIEKVKNADLLIILDSSSNDIEGVKKSLEIMKDGSEVLILDHHQFDSLEIESEMDKLATVVNIQHSKDTYPNKSLSGAGVVYKVSKGIDLLTYDNDGHSDMYLDLVAVGLVGDMMSVMEIENRYLINYGLKNVNNIGLQRILKGAGVNIYKYNSKDIGFSVAPLINASARMGQIELAIEILLVDNDKDAKSLRLKMKKLNEQRQALQKEVFEKYEREIDLSKKIILIIDGDSNKGFNGLVAQNIARKYQRPCFVVGQYGDMYMGSGRSFGNFDTQGFLSELEWVEASGHKQSHGLNFPVNKLEELEQYIEDNMDNEAIRNVRYYYDFVIDENEVWYNIEDVESLNYITGTGFPEVIARIDGVMVESRDVIGKTKETVKFKTTGDLVLIKFKVDEEWSADIGMFDTVSCVGTPLINEFYNFGKREMIRTPQIIIQDIITD